MSHELLLINRTHVYASVHNQTVYNRNMIPTVVLIVGRRPALSAVKIPFFTFFFCGVKHSRRPIIRVPESVQNGAGDMATNRKKSVSSIKWWTSVISPERFIRKLLNQDACSGFHNWFSACIQVATSDSISYGAWTGRSKCRGRGTIPWTMPAQRLVKVRYVWGEIFRLIRCRNSLTGRDFGCQRLKAMS